MRSGPAFARLFREAISDMTLKSTTVVATAKASGYLQQLCKHFGHKIEVEFTPDAGSISFDFGRSELSASPLELTMHALAETQEDLARLKKVMSSHLERFAFRENLQLNWTD